MENLLVLILLKPLLVLGAVLEQEHPQYLNTILLREEFMLLYKVF